MRSYFAKSVLNCHPWFIRWPEHRGPHSSVLGGDDLDKLGTPSELSARKFGISRAPEVYDLIGECLLSRRLERET